MNYYHYSYFDLLKENSHLLMEFSDDKGNDDSSIIIKNIQEEYPNKIRIIEHEVNQGLSIVRNTGIDNAKGKYLFFLDGDDEITPNCIESLYKILSSTKTTMTIGRMKAKDTFNNSEYEIFPKKELPNSIIGNNLIFKYFCSGSWAVSACNKLFELNFIKQNRIYFVKGLYSQDELWSFHLALKLDSISFLEEFTYIYYLHNASIVFNKKKINFENHQTIIEYFTQSYNE